ncbi:MAG: HAD-IIA family hydrolase [Halanaeroarchaeum sp.]
MQTDAAIVDLDGTVYRGDEVLPGAVEGIRTLSDAGVDVRFFSNNPLRTPAEYADRLTAMGIDADPGDVLTSGSVSAAFLAGQHPEDDVYLVGEPGLARQLSRPPVTDPHEADVVFGSIDREFTYDRLADGVRALRSAYAFYGTDPDRTIPTSGDDVVPGSGAILAALSTAAERDPTILGKPSETAASAALDSLGVEPVNCIVVGDRIDTDVAMAGAAGMRSVLVLTGAHGERDVDRFDETPDYVLDSVGAIGNVLGEGGDRRETGA